MDRGKQWLVLLIPATVQSSSVTSASLAFLPLQESRPAPRTVSRRLSPGLPTAHQYVQNAAAKRRLSYDYNRNIME